MFSTKSGELLTIRKLEEPTPLPTITVIFGTLEQLIAAIILAWSRNKLPPSIPAENYTISVIFGTLEQLIAAIILAWSRNKLPPSIPVKNNTLTKLNLRFLLFLETLFLSIVDINGNSYVVK